MIIPKGKRRPWEPKRKKYNNMQGQGRRVVTNFYHTSAWRTLRNSFVKVNPFCIKCEPLLVPTHTVDHIKPINPLNPFDTQNGIYGEPLLWENLQPLCKHCNAVKTGKERHKKQSYE